jgi:cell division protein FtsI/penicillin-binding protein 2
LKKIFPRQYHTKIKKSREAKLSKKMAVDDKNISYRIYPVAFAILLMALAIAFKLTNIQWVEGSYYRQLAKERMLETLLFC